MQGRVPRMTNRYRYAAAAWLLSLVGAPGAAWAQDKPLWELGLGAGVLRAPDYRGSANHTTYVAPIPYLIYRGRHVQVDREGVHGDLLKTERTKTSWSLAAGVPAKSRADGARAGMPDLDPTVEIGPSLEIFLHRDAAGDREWSLRLPLRAVIATDLRHSQGVGWVFAPHLHLNARRLGGGWEGSLGVGPLYASEAYHDYYYEVAPAYATATRPQYDAQDGYSGSRVTLTLTRRFDGYWIGAFARYDTLAGAAFADSPLVQKKESFMIGVGVAWVFAQSGTRVNAP